MIKCNGIRKAYGANVVIESFSYEFADTGFYLLLGESGSGKTTLLNVLSGMTDFDGGTVEIGGDVFSERVGLGEDVFDYIIQDTFFADHLTVTDNMRLIKSDDGQIAELLRVFGLSEKKEQYPSTLSGGERQRLAAARSQLSEKKILFLDEPTAALDEDNKRAVFSYFAGISKSCLVICASHDAEARDYADHVIEFRNSGGAACAASAKNSVKKKAAVQRRVRRGAGRGGRDLRPFVEKWFSSVRRSRRPEVMFVIFLTLSLCLIMLADTPRHKMEANGEHLYRINVIRMATSGRAAGEYESILEMKGVRDVLVGYCIPDEADPNDYFDPETGVMEAMPVSDYDPEGHFIPSDPKTFRLSDRIAYGSYFTDKYQVILSADRAEFLAPDDPESLLGQTVRRNIYPDGQVELEIVGIFDYFNEVDRKYLCAMDVYPAPSGDKNYTYDNEIYINGDIIRPNADDPVFFGEDSQRSYEVFFDSFRGARDFYEKNNEFFFDRGVRISFLMSDAFELETSIYYVFSYVMLPLAAMITLLSILFYTNITKTELQYNSRFVSVFNYAGYSIPVISHEILRGSILRLLFMCAVSGAAAALLTTAVNIVNRRLLLAAFEIFTYNLPLLAASVALICAAASLTVWYLLRRIGYKSWYENIIAARDLL